MKRIRYIKDNLYYYIGIACLFFAAFVSLYSPAANTVGLYLTIPLACMIATLFNKGFHTNIYEKLLYGLFVWDCIAYLWADNKELASTELHMILGAFLLVYCISIFARKLRFIPYLYFVYVLLYLSAWNYAIHNIFTMMVDDSDRLNDEILNANTMAYYTFYVSYLLFMLWHISKNKWMKRTWLFLFWIMIPASFGVSLLTASRQVMIIQVPLYSLLIYQRYFKGSSMRKKMYFSLVALTVMVSLSGKIINTYDNSFLKKRAEKNVADDSRMELVRDATKVALKNMPLGVGSANYQGVSSRRQISHNSYLEAFVNMGIIGLILYAALMMSFTIRQWKRYKRYDDKMYFYFFTFGLIYVLDGVFFVFYNAIWLISFFMLVAAHSETYYIEHHKELNKNKKEELSTHCRTQEQML